MKSLGKDYPIYGVQARGIAKMKNFQKFRGDGGGLLETCS